MKENILSILLVISIVVSKAQENLKYCGADELRISTLKVHPAIADAVIKRDIELEKFTAKFVHDFYSQRKHSAVYIIPVVFHVIHNYGTENISDAQILDGLDILNKTFRKQLADTSSIVAAFKPLHADCEIEFHLAQLDTNGNCTNGINRIASPLTTVGDHSVKSLIQWPPNKYLNIYIVQNAAGLAGHCVWPSDADTIPAWDGIVITSSYVGSIGTSNYTQSVALAHECGHYFNLQHIWGGNNVPGFYYYPCANPNKDCNIDDLVADTPPTIGWLTCNLNGASCGNVVDNVQNTMDYSYCNRMFTYGQKARMQACLNSSIAGRNNLWQTANLIATGVFNAPGPLCKADFSSDKNVVCQSSSNVITFSNTSYNGSFSGMQWTFPGGTPSTDTSASPVVIYTMPGAYNVSLKVFNGNDSAEVTKTTFISVLPDAGNPYPFTEGFETTASLNGMEWFSNSLDTINHWQLTSQAAYSGSKSVMLNNFDNTMSTKDELYSPVINLSGGSGLTLRFKYAYAKKDSASNDRLQVFFTSNCNTGWTQRLTLQGTTLETAPLASSSFIPSSTLEWKQASVFIPSPYFTSGFRFKFVYNSNGGNNFFIDDINLDVSSGVDELNKINDSFQLFPNPATDQVNISFNLLRPEKLHLSIENIVGQTIYELGKENYSEGEHQFILSTKYISQGVYFIKIANEKSSFKKTLLIMK